MQKQDTMELKQILLQISEFTSKMLSEPNHFWDNVLERKNSIQIFNHFYLPYVIISALACTLGDLFSGSEFLVSYSILKGVREATVFLGHFYISVFIINKLVAIFGGKINKESSQLAVGFSMTPFFLVSIITGFLPFLYIVNVLGLYGLYLFYDGVPKLFNIPKHRIKIFTITVILVNFFIFALLSLAFWKLLEAYY